MQASTTTAAKAAVICDYGRGPKGPLFHGSSQLTNASEDYGFVAVDENAVSDVQADRAREDDLLQVAALAD